jgi:hypothetical protein
MGSFPLLRRFHVAPLNTIVSRALLVACMFTGLMLAASAQAATYSFSYRGSGAPFGGSVNDIAAGTGTFTVSDTANPAVLGDVSGFTFNLSVTYKPQPNATTGTDKFDYFFANLTGFVAGFSNGTLTSLSFATDLQAASLYWAEAFMVGSLDPGAAFTGDGDSNIISSGTITITGNDIPEPAGLSIVAPGLLAMSLRRRRAPLTPRAD